MGKLLVSWFTLFFVRLIGRTYRFRHAGQPGVGPPSVAGNYILAIWHQNLFAGILAQTGRQHVVMVSRSRDGDPVTGLCEGLGHVVARGSSKSGDRDKGGRAARDDMIRVLQSGVPGALTVDGPRGPAFQVKPGIIDMARATGASIVPYLPLPRRYWSMKSWDAFRLPKPFTRVDVYYGAPIAVPADTSASDVAGFQDRVASALMDLERTHTQRSEPGSREAA